MSVKRAPPALPGCPGSYAFSSLSEKRKSSDSFYTSRTALALLAVNCKQKAYSSILIALAEDCFGILMLFKMIAIYGHTIDNGLRSGAFNGDVLQVSTASNHPKPY